VICGQKLRCPRVDCKLRCPKCKTVMDVLAVCAKSMALLDEIEQALQDDDPDQVATLMEAAHYVVEPPEDEDDVDEDDD
jgi:hypothetical protein